MSKKLGISVRAKRSIAYESLEARNLLATFTATEGTSFFWGIMKPKRLRSRSNKNALSSAYGRLEARNLLATFSTGGVPSTVYVDFSDGRPAAIEINGESFENPDDTIHIEIKGYESDPNRRNYLHFRGDDFNMKLERFTGSVNGVATFEHAGDTTNFYTGDGNDTVEEGGSGYGFFGIFVDTGAGDDTFIYNGGGTFNSLNLGQLRGDLGAGDDHFIYRSDQSGYQTINGGFKEYVFSGGEGNDTWESELTSGTYADSSNIFPTASEGFERFVAVDPSALDNGAANAFRSNRDATFIVQDNITTIIYSGSTSDETPDDTVVTLENFNLIEGNSDRIPSLRAGVAFVVATSYPMQLERFEIVNVGGDFEAGDTSGIKADLTISNNNILVVANSGSTEAQNVFVTNSLSADGERTENRISGLAPATIITSGVEHTNLAGSSTAGDRFHVTRFDSHLVMFGFGGDDGFSIGHDEGGLTRDLSLAGKAIAIVAGEGNDFVWASDAGSGAERHFRVQDHWIHAAAGDPFLGIYFDGTEDVYLDMDYNSPRVYMTPSEETQFVIQGGLQYVDSSDPGPNPDILQAYVLIPPVEGSGHLIDNNDATFTHWWADKYRLIYMLPNLPR